MSLADSKDRLELYERAKHIAHGGSIEEKSALASDPHTPPEVLYYLATDENEKVRMQVARNHVTPRHADVLLAKDKSEVVKEALVTKVSKQLTTFDRRGDDQQTALMDSLLENLANDKSVHIRRALANAIKALANLSRKLILMLAKDKDPMVAEHILQFSPLLDDHDLETIMVEYKDCPHMAEAIAKRQNLSDRLSNHISYNEGDKAVSHLLSNKTAQMSNDALDYLAEGARDRPEWQEPLSQRPHLSEDAIKKLATILSTSLLKTMLEKNHIKRDQVSEVLEIVKGRLDSGEIENEVMETLLSEPPEYATPYERAKSDFMAGLLNEDMLYKAIDEKDRAYVIGAIAVLTRLEYEAVLKAVNLQNAKGLVSMSWKAGLTPRFSVSFQQKVAGLISSRTLYPRQGEEYPMSENDMLWQIELFSDMV